MAEYLEKARALHEDVERGLDDLAQEVGVKPVSHRHRIHHEHFLNQCIEGIVDRKRKVRDIYDSPEAKRPHTLPASVIEKDFFERLAELREYHRKFPELKPEAKQTRRCNAESLPVSFSREECHGECLDLHALYQTFMELPCNYELALTRGKEGFNALRACRVRQLDYINWLKLCTQFHNIQRKHKTHAYADYLTSFLAYLTDFYSRNQPLSPPPSEILADARANFRERWQRKEVSGWEDTAGELPAAAGEGVKLSKAQRRLVQHFKVAELEDQVQRFYDLLGDTLQTTLSFLDRKETMTRHELIAEERRAEAEVELAMEAAHQPAKEKDASDEPIVPNNPLKLPIGWDGKPIPYWLYKLHGLNMKFTCEICRGYTYIGPKAFDKHFQEWRHAHGMRCLRIPNTRHFHHVTRVVDAQRLWEKMRQENGWRQWRPDAEQEFEDVEGHVFNKRTLEDMRRQGLLVRTY